MDPSQLMQNHPVRRDDLRVKPVASHIETPNRPSSLAKWQTNPGARASDPNDSREASDEPLGRARRRSATGNARQLIAIRIATGLLAQLRRLAAKQSRPIRLYFTNCPKALRKRRSLERTAAFSSRRRRRIHFSVKPSTARCTAAVPPSFLQTVVCQAIAHRH